ncbi:MAG: hypothetical protein C4519_00115 [Desulfobacteraceae bacterium]|nr:MAG: hypothetical protein C4519_00115 [Desulfobacteraceae bacterium]
MKMRPSQTWTFLLCFFILLPSACMRPSSAPRSVHYYTLNYPGAVVPIERALPLVLRVERFNAAPPFNSQRIIYADKGSHRNAYTYFQWVAAPGELIAFFLARDLKHSRGFQAVLTPDTALAPTHTVTGWVEEFLEEDFSEPAQACASIHLLLIDARNPDPLRRILLQKSYRAKAPCGSKTPAALSEAMSAVMAELSVLMIQDIYERLSQTQQL